VGERKDSVNRPLRERGLGLYELYLEATVSHILADDGVSWGGAQALTALREQLADGAWHSFRALLVDAGRNLTPEACKLAWRSQHAGAPKPRVRLAEHIHAGREILLHALLARVAEYRSGTAESAFGREYRLKA
jgi:hypothetical protein